MLPSIALPIVARLLNQYLKLDLEMQERLEKFDRRAVRVTITTFD